MITALLISSCKAIPGAQVSSATHSIQQAAQDPDRLTILSMIGGLCIVAGMGLIVVTAGKKGWYPTIGGLLMVVLNYMIAKYDDYLFIPAVICTGLISAAWTYKTLQTILKEKVPHDHGKRI
jgi:hypothetical protein